MNIVIINGTAISQGMGKTARDIRDSLDFWGVARVYTIKQPLFQGSWELVDDKRKKAIGIKCKKVIARLNNTQKPVKPRLKVKGLFFIMKTAQKMIDKSERKAGRKRTKDYEHWKSNGWLDGKKPWRD